MATLRCDTENAVDQVSILDKLRDVLVCHDISQEPVPTKLGTYRINKCELKGQLRDLALTQLRDRGCPHEVLSPLAAAIASAVENSTDDLKGCLPQSAGGGDGPEEYNVLQLHKLILSTIGEFGKKVRGGELDALGFLKGIDGASPRISVASVKNTRRKMEDRFNYVPDLSALYEIQGAPPTSFYGVFDGHAGTDAATYAASLLHERIASSPHYISDLGKAIHDAFTETDAHFCEKKLESGTTAVICLIRGKTLYVAWLGDSQAMLVRGGKPIAVVDPHKPERKDEKLRIENLGGCVIHYGTWRVQGHLAVSRAIGDQQYKPFVTGEPDVEEVGLDGTEDVLVLACDGLWDQVSFPQAVDIVYNHFQKHPRDVEGSSKALVQAARQRGSTDNITVILVCLRDPCLMAAPPAADPGTTTASGLEENGFEREDIPEWARAMKLRYEMEYGMMGASPPHKFNGFQVGPGGDAPPDAAPPAPLQTELDEEEEERRQLAKFMKVHDDEDIEQQPTPEEVQSALEAIDSLPEEDHDDHGEGEASGGGIAGVDDEEDEEEEAWNYFKMEPSHNNPLDTSQISSQMNHQEDVHAKSELEQFLAQESAARDISQPLPDILPQSEEEATPLSKLSPLAPEFYPSHPHASNPADTEAIEKSPLGSMEQEIEALSLRETADPFGMQLANPPPKDVVQYPTPDLMQVQTPYTNPFLVPENNDQVPENNEQFPTHITPTEDQHDLKSESQEHFLEKEAQEHDLVRDALQHDLEKDVNEHDLEREDQEHDVKREVQELIPDIYLAPSEEQQPQTEEECCSPIHKYEAGSSDLLFLGDPGKAKEPDNLHSLREVQSEAQFKPCVYREQELHRSPEVENLNNMPETASMNQNAPAVPQELHLHHANDVEDLSQVSPLTPVSESIDITKSDTKVTKESEEVEVLAAPCDSKAMDLEDIQLLGAATADLLESNKMNISISSGSELGPASPQEQISDTNLIPMEITSEVISSPEPPSPKPVVEPEVSKLDIESVAAVATVAAAAVAEASPAPKKSPTQVSPSKAGPKKQAGAKPAEKKPPSPTKTQAKPAATQPTKTDRTAKPAAMKPAPKTTTAPRPAATQKPTEPAKRPASRPTTSTTAPKPKPNPVASTARKVHTGISNSLRPTGAPASTAAPSTAAKPTTTRASTSPGAKARAPLRLAGTRPPATATHTKPSMASTTARPATSNNVAAKPSRPATAGTTATAGATKRPTARTSTMTTARHPTSKPASAVTRARPATATATTTATGATSKPAATKPSTAKEPSKPQASRKPAAPSKVSPIKSPRAATGASKPKAGEAKKISKTPESKSPGKDGTQVSEGAPATDCALVDFGAPDKDDVSVVEGAPTVGAPSLESNPQLVNGDV